jgi:two-component system, OmpR family, KDP operon response regulator KdpE
MSDDSHARILVVDDESSLRRALSASLTMMGFIVSAQPTGEQAIECVRNELFDAVLLDINMPGMGGMATCRVLRQQYPRLGILMVTVRQDPKDKVEALEAGADDYVVKPFHLPELVARLRAVVRRTRLTSPDEPTPIRIGDLELSWRDRSLTKSGQPVHLTPNEFALLHHLMSHAGELVPHSDVFRALWEQEEGGDPRRLRSLVRQLRKKIESNAEEPTYLVTEPGFGYRFRACQRSLPSEDPLL